MAHADEIAEQPVPVEATREDRDATAPRKLALLPIGTRLPVQMRPEELPVVGDIGGRVGTPEEAVEVVVARQPHERGELQPIEGDVGAVEIDGLHRRRIGEQVGQGVAAARGDRYQPVPRPDGERDHVHVRVFPDLRIDKPREQLCEQPLGQAGAREHAVAPHRAMQPPPRQLPL